MIKKLISNFFSIINLNRKTNITFLKSQYDRLVDEAKNKEHHNQHTKKQQIQIRTFGDSHSVNGWPDYVVKNHLGPTLAYSFGREGLDRLDITKYEINEGDHLVFSFGEIDCRCQLSKYHNRDEYRSFEPIIDLITINYLKAVKENIDKLGKEVSVWIYNVLPPARKGAFEENQSYPILGTDAERKDYILYMNNRLKSHALQYGWKFFDVYDKYKDEMGVLDWKLSDGNVHVGNGIHIEEFIQQNIK
jgi:hypothetical protein